MKRIGNLYEKIISLDNLHLADKKASRGKSRQLGVIRHVQHREENLLRLHETLTQKRYRTSEYSVFKIFEPKERIIYRLPYYPDRIVHHAIMNVLEPIFVSTFTADTYSCIKGRGIHKAFYRSSAAVRDVVNARYCLKLDVKKFFPSVDHGILKSLLRRKFKDEELLVLLDEIIDSTDGLPIGNYLSAYLGNFYLTYFDHWLKEVKKLKTYFRYCDDMVILHSDKIYLHALRLEITEYLREMLRLEVKDNHQVFLVKSRGLDFVGYRSYPTHVLLRKKIKQNFINMIRHRYSERSITSYMGWIGHCNGVNLLNKYVKAL